MVQPSIVPVPLDFSPTQSQNKSLPLEPDGITAPLQLQAQHQMQPLELDSSSVVPPATLPSPVHLPAQMQIKPSEAVSPPTRSPAMPFQIQQSSISPLQQSTVSTKHGRSFDNDQQSLPKRLKYINDDIDEEIERHRKG